MTTLSHAELVAMLENLAQGAESEAVRVSAIKTLLGLAPDEQLRARDAFAELDELAERRRASGR